MTVKSIFLSAIVMGLMLQLSACQSTSEVEVNLSDILYDEGFSGFKQFEIEPESEIFYIGEEAKAFVKQTLSVSDNPEGQLQALVKTLFDRSKFNLLYDGYANTVANETFQNRAANCLSMSIMTYALAEEAGLGVTFQEIEIPEYWTRKNGYSLLNGHINLRLLPKSEPNVYAFQVSGYQVDFDPQSARKNLPKRVVSKTTVLAMFYNNKGADALIKNQFNQAYAYFRQAVLTQARFDSALINLGILYRMKGFYEQAEKTYEYALALDPESMTAWENLAYLYEFTQRHDAAVAILKKVERQREANPFYHVNLAEQAFEAAEYQQALAHYKKALSLDRKKHEIYFGLSKVYFKLGDVAMTEHYLQMAKDYANNIRDEERYQSKLNFLTSL